MGRLKRLPTRKAQTSTNPVRVRTMSVVMQRLLGAISFTIALGTSFYVRGEIGAENFAHSDRIAAHFPSLERATSKALQRKHHLDMAPELYVRRIREDAGKLNIAAPDVDVMRKPQKVHHPVQQGLTVPVGASRRFGALNLRVSGEPVKLRKGGASVKTRHTIARLRNQGKSPIAYYAQMHLEKSLECTNRGVYSSNMLALMPGEEALITVCARVGSVVIDDLRYMEISELGYHYITSLPARAFLLDKVTASAHRISDACSLVPASRLVEAQKRGNLQWEDIVDFFSRHSCRDYALPNDYHYQAKGLSQLPYGASASLEEALARDRAVQ